MFMPDDTSTLITEILKGLEEHLTGQRGQFLFSHQPILEHWLP